ncbi:MAG: TrmB family transcriptional regulator [Candidatus Hydrothermarchaeota archaeon]
MKLHEIQRQLQDLGMTEAETKTYLLLLSRNQATAGELSKLSGFSRPKVYEALDKLTKWGLLEVQYKRPKVFRALDPNNALKNFVLTRSNELQEMSDQIIPYINQIYLKRRETREEETTVWIVSGEQNYLIKLEEILRSAKKEIRIVNGYFLRNEFKIIENIIMEKKDRNARVKIVARKRPIIPDSLDEKDLEKLKKEGIIRTISPLIRFGEKEGIMPPIKITLVDSKAIFICLPGIKGDALLNVTGLYFENDSFAKSFMLFWDMLWEIAKES